MEGIGTMSYQVETTVRFDKEFKKLDRYTQRMIKSWIDKHLVGCIDLRQHGKCLTIIVMNKIFDIFIPEFVVM